MTEFPPSTSLFDYNLSISEKTSQKKRTERPEACGICRKPAIGHFYEVPSCNSCKSFFRRTIITGRRYNCRGNGNCLDGNEPVVAKYSKWICGRCRFAKCTELGMNPKSIKIELISEKGKILMEEIIKSREDKLISKSFESIEEKLNSKISQLKIAENQLEILHSKGIPSNFEDTRNLTQILQGFPIFEVSKISNLKFSKDQLYPDHAGMCHTSLLSVIEFSKLLEFFPKISIESQKILILNSALIATNLANSYYSLQKFRSDIIRRADGTLSGKPMRNYNGICMDFRKILQRTLHVFLSNRIDFIEYMFIKAIVICNPTLSGLSTDDVKIIENQRIQYVQNLFNYCLKQYGQVHGPDRLGAILSMMPTMEIQLKEQKSFAFVLRYFHPKATVIVSPLYDEVVEAS